MRFHKPSISVTHTVNGISRRVTVSEREERGMTSMFCCKHPFAWRILLCGAASGRLWLKIWERRNKNSFCWYLQRLKTGSCKDSDLTEFERTVVLQNDYINRMSSFTVWSLCARVCVCVCCKYCSMNLSVSPLVSHDAGKQQSWDCSVGMPQGQVNLSGSLKPTPSACNMG